ncbi:hypothetical protein LWF15_25410 [Kineosporia rhizophila]|uniref:AfsR/SARP family transcriptional regulator n=1 Tax=Kineosporia rhizophila TaxID=84633 RepID=UPI001E646DF2|nr:BTAD domain-containing putative transcriptional regulator [Kineosporia rhizophila]MCE0538842.1 hypothetical protein [Kineosporia rhizophila]
MFPTSASAAAVAGSGPIRLRLIGDFDVLAGSQALPVRRCGQKLLAFLAITRGSVGRPTLAGTLWPESPGARAAANLRASISRLPRPGGRQLVRSNGSRLALAEDVRVDLHEASDLITSPDAQRDPPPENWYADLLPFWEEDWVLLERERFRQSRLHALEHSSQQLREQRRFGEALQAALRALAGEPLRESAHRLVIEAHLAEGNAAEALRQYHQYRALLRTELGIAPSGEIRQLVRPLLERPED